MNVYLAGIYTSNFHKLGQLYAQLDGREKYARDGVRHYLESYHYINKQRYVDTIRDDNIKVFLDSGAYSSFTKGILVDLPAYCEYIKQNWDLIKQEDGVLLASVLDAIGDPLGTYNNQQHMEWLGVRPLPCYHYGEDIRWLEYYMKNYSYITIGGMVPISTKQLYHWLDQIWDKYLTDGAGHPKIKVHGFGMTTIELITRYPWHSVDSSTWVQNAAFGMLYVPGRGLLNVSSKSPTAKKKNSHLDTYCDVQSEAASNMLREQGFDPERVREQYFSRWAYNCWAFDAMNDIPDHPFKASQMGFFE